MAMEKERKILFVLYEGLADTVIDAQVLALAKEIKLKLKYEMEVWAFACTNKIYNKSLEKIKHAEKHSNVKVKVYKALKPSIPLSRYINQLIFFFLIFSKRKNFDLIHSRTDYTASILGKIAKTLSIPMIWDCRGDAISEFEERSKKNIYPRFVNNIKLNILKKEKRLAGMYCTKAIFVSNELLSISEKLIGGKPRYVIPCLSNQDDFFFNQKIREIKRKELNYENEKIVFIYSGAIVQYQCFDKVVEIFCEIKKIDSNIKLLVITPHIEAAKEMTLGMSDVDIFSCAYKDVNAYLNAADIAFMIRENKQLNTVAFPTKFSEYSLAGLSIIMNEVVKDCVKIAKNNNNYIFSDLQSILNSYRSNYDRKNVSEKARKVLTREAVVNKYLQIYE